MRVKVSYQRIPVLGIIATGRDVCLCQMDSALDDIIFCGTESICFLFQILPVLDLSFFHDSLDMSVLSRSILDFGLEQAHLLPGTCVVEDILRSKTSSLILTVEIILSIVVNNLLINFLAHLLEEEPLFAL